MTGRTVLRQPQNGQDSAGAAPAVGVRGKAVWAAATGLFMLAVVVGIILGAVRFAFSWQPVYTYAITAYRAEDSTDVSASSLLAATHRIRNYFTNDERDLDIRVADRSGQVEPLFNEREIVHMRDVKALVGRLYLLLDAAALYALLYVLATFLLRANPARSLGGATLVASMGAAAVLVGVGVASLIGFDQLFTEFHALSFNNDFWELDPARDHLVQIFPAAYWFDVTMFVGLVALVGALAIALFSGTALLGLRRRGRPDSGSGSAG